MNFIKRVIVISLALFLAAFLMRNMDGFQLTRDGWSTYLVMALILAVLNAILTPFLKTMSCLLIILTLGLFNLVLNTFVFWLASEISVKVLNGGFQVTKFWPALVGSIIVSLADLIFLRKSNGRSKKEE